MQDETRASNSLSRHIVRPEGNGDLSRRDWLIGVAALASCISTAATAAPDTAALAAEVIALVSAYNTTGNRLFDEISQERGNRVLSPFSIGMAMAMAMAGARGETEREMAGALSQTLTHDRMAAANMRLLGQVPAKCPAEANPQKPCDQKALDLNRLDVANAIALPLPIGDVISPDYIQLLRTQFSAEVIGDASAQKINDWVAAKTQHKIENLIEELPPDVVAVLVNAIYFKAAWAHPFDKARTVDGPFNTAEGASRIAKMMHIERDFAWARKEGFRMICLPFAGETMSCIIALPDDPKRVDAMSAKLDAPTLSSLIPRSQGDTDYLVLTMPKFKAMSKINLVPAFQRLGLQLAFTPSADFGGMDGGHKKISINDIVHQAVVELAEDGAEAAAATGSWVTTTSAREPKPPEIITVDHPFLFYFIENATGAVLFQGRIDDPTVEA